MNERAYTLRKDMDSYLSARKGKKFTFKELLKRKDTNHYAAALSPDVSAYTEIPHGQQKETTEILEGEYETEKKGWFDHVLERVGLGSKPPREEDFYEAPARPEGPTLEHDLKDVARVALFTIKRLPVEDIQDFKQTPEFQLLKEILKRRNLIK